MLQFLRVRIHPIRITENPAIPSQAILPLACHCSSIIIIIITTAFGVLPDGCFSVWLLLQLWVQKHASFQWNGTIACTPMSALSLLHTDSTLALGAQSLWLIWWLLHWGGGYLPHDICSPCPPSLLLLLPPLSSSVSQSLYILHCWCKQLCSNLGPFHSHGLQHRFTM